MDKGHIQFIYCFYNVQAKIYPRKIPNFQNMLVQFFGKKSEGLENNKKKMEDFDIFLDRIESGGKKK